MQLVVQDQEVLMVVLVDLGRQVGLDHLVQLDSLVLKVDQVDQDSLEVKDTLALLAPQDFEVNRFTCKYLKYNSRKIQKCKRLN